MPKQVWQVLKVLVNCWLLEGQWRAHWPGARERLASQGNTIINTSETSNVKTSSYIAAFTATIAKHQVLSTVPYIVCPIIAKFRCWLLPRK